MQKPVNPNASPNAKKLLDFLSESAGHKIITGQHTQTVEMEEVSYIKSITGSEPMLRGFELLSYSPNINYDDASEECLKEVYANRNTLDEAYRWALSEERAVLAFTFHWFSPLGGRDKSFFSENTDFDARRILEAGTPEQSAFYSDMDVIAGHLKRFLDKDIPILWRPFHESDGVWFWWGRYGCEVAAELYRRMYKHYTEKHHLDNLLWVWNCPLKEGYPGDEYVDVVTRDLYPEDDTPTDFKKEYDELVGATSKNKVAALGEVGRFPDVNVLSETHTPWAYYMTWSGEFCMSEKFNTSKKLKSMYQSEYSLKL